MFTFYSRTQSFHTRTPAPPTVDHKVVSPYTQTQCCLPIPPYLLRPGIKHLIQSVLRRPQSQTISSILDLKHLTRETLKNILSVNNLTIRSQFKL